MDIQLFDKDLHIELINRTPNSKNNATQDYIKKYSSLIIIQVTQESGEDTGFRWEACWINKEPQDCVYSQFNQGSKDLENNPDMAKGCSTSGMFFCSQLSNRVWSFATNTDW